MRCSYLRQFPISSKGVVQCTYTRPPRAGGIHKGQVDLSARMGLASAVSRATAASNSLHTCRPRNLHSLPCHDPHRAPGPRSATFFTTMAPEEGVSNSYMASDHRQAGLLNLDVRRSCSCDMAAVPPFHMSKIGRR